MPETGDALQQLRDIHLPHPVGWWPLAMGWYLLGILVCVLFFGTLSLVIRHHIRDRNKRQALRLLDSLQQEHLKTPNSAMSAARISELLKRVALFSYPRKRVAGLQGQAWVDFLTETSQRIDFNRVRELLIELPFQPDNTQDISLLFELAKQWIAKRGKRCLN